jgi:hypothetical protein
MQILRFSSGVRCLEIQEHWLTWRESLLLQEEVPGYLS